MKTGKNIFWAFGMAMAIFAASRVQAQFMPVVYDRSYGKEIHYEQVCPDFSNGDVVAVGENGGHPMVIWLNRLGESILSRKFPAGDFAKITNVFPLQDGKVLLVGCRTVPPRDNRGATGRAIVLTSNGVVEQDVRVGEPGSCITLGRQLADGSLILGGDSPAVTGGRKPFVCKISPSGRVIYNYIPTAGEVCVGLNVLGSSTEYLHVAFSSKDNEGSCVVRLDERGKPFFITQLPDRTFHIEKMASTVDGDLYLVGEGQKAGGAVIKIRPEGDIVFQKQIVPTSVETKLDQLIVCPTGEIMVGGNDLTNSYYAQLRPDGTELISQVDRGVIAGITHDPVSGSCVASLYNPETSQGKIVKFSRQGHRMYEKNTAASYTSLRINGNGDLLMGSPTTGRLSMLSSLGELLFDRYVVENTPTPFAAASLPANGEAVFLSDGSRIIKLAHGIYMSDIQVSKPIMGSATATFTVTLSGYSFTPEGAPLPVTVDYKTRPVTASEGVNYDPVAGTLSFVPSTDGSDRYLNKFAVEVPINANDLLEGSRTFNLDLSNISNSYLIRSSSQALIKDQPAIVRLIGTKAGIEGEQDIVYELGIFKTNGVALTNATRANIVIDGIYGKGTADQLDFDMGRLPRLTIQPDMHSGQYRVQTKEDTRYESVKSVVIDFSQIYAMSDTDVHFSSSVLSCKGELYDQPALVAIESLGDFGRKNNVVSGFFKVSLLRAKDGALLTNCSGGDILIDAAIDQSTTGQLGQDFVLTNLHDLRIWGDDKSSTVNINGMVLYSPDSASRNVVVKLNGAKAVANGGKISVSPSKAISGFVIRNK